MLFVCIMLFLSLIFANDSCFHALSWLIDTLFVYFKYDFASCTVLFNLLVFPSSMFNLFVEF